MSESPANRIYGATGIETIMFGSDLTVAGSGQIGNNVTTIINAGTILADQVVELRIDPNAGGFDNRGTLRAENGAELRLESGPFTTSGSVVATAGSTITRAATDYIQTAGSTMIDGSLNMNAGGVVTLNGGSLGGTGQVNADVDNAAGAAAPGNSAGTLTINAIEGFVPASDDTFTVLTTAVPPIVGGFTAINDDGLPGGFRAIVEITATAVIVRITGCAADIDGDGTVGILDFLDVLTAWGDCP